MNPQEAQQGQRQEGSEGRKVNRRTLLKGALGLAGVAALDTILPKSQQRAVAKNMPSASISPRPEEAMAAIALATATATTTPVKESTRNLETLQTVTYDNTLDLRTDGQGHIVKLAQETGTAYGQGPYKVLVGDLDFSTGKISFQDIGTVPFFPRSLDFSRTNPDLIGVVGAKGPSIDQDYGEYADVAVSTKEWQIVNTTQGGIFYTRIGTDGITEYASEEGRSGDNAVLITKINLSDGTYVYLPVLGAGSQPEFSAFAQFFANSSALQTFGVMPVNVGYFLLTETSGSMQAQQLQTNEGYLANYFITYIDSQGRNNVLGINNDTSNGGPFLYRDRYDSTNTLKDHTAFKTPIIRSDAVDTTEDILLIGTINVTWDSAGNPIYTSVLKMLPNFSNTTGGDISSALQDVPGDGDWDPKAIINQIDVERKNGETYWVLGTSSGVLTRRVTNGINSTDVWQKATDTLLAPTPTPTQEPTPAPEPTVTPTPTVASVQTYRVYLPNVDK